MNIFIRFSQLRAAFVAYYTPNCVILPLMKPYKPSKLGNGSVGWCFQVNIHEFVRKFFEKFVQSRNFIFLSNYQQLLHCSKGLNLFLQFGHLLKGVIVDTSIFSCGSIQMSVVMDDQMMIFCLANIEFEHMREFVCFPEELECVFWSFEPSAPVTNAEYFSCFGECCEYGVRASMFVANGKAEEEKRDQDIAAGDDKPEPVQVHRLMM